MNWLRTVTTRAALFRQAASGLTVAIVFMALCNTLSAQQQPPAKQSPATKVTSSVTSPHGPALREACASCHRAEGWTPLRVASSFRHAPRTFPLTGSHERVTCMSCHKKLDFQSATTNCASCHADPHQSEFGVTCARCHNTRSFVDRGTSVRTHQATRFPLRGAHAIATCESCHKQTGTGQAQYSGRATTCESCHLATYRATKSPDHTAANFPTNCSSCHTISTWTGATFDHNATKFPLTGKHQIATCQGCHADGVFTGRSTTCVSCHQSDYAAAQQPRHGQGFPTTCASCHGTAQWKGATFDHQTSTRFPLTGRHLTATCSSCHVNGVYTGTPATCISCHKTNFDASRNPPHAAARFSTSCEGCHTTGTWSGAPFDHNTTKFALTGGHRTVTCAGCHADNVFVGKSQACASCHQTIANATTNPHHVEAKFSTTCESCHTTSVWRGARYDHNQTRFGLTGAHVPATCLACHSDKVYAGKPSNCVSCHQSNFASTTQPNHQALGFPATCESCHTTTKWLGAAFDHATTTRFPLTGAHRVLTCASCHSDGVFSGKPMTCVGCHQATFNATTRPHHGPAGFASTCESCHTTAQWTGLAFDHTKTAFPLLGRHLSATCLACHNDRVYAGKPSVCASCHQADYDGSRTPDHRASGIPATCESCHTATAWKPANFDHNATQFPLLGAHRTVNCASCHGDGVYKGKPTTCVNCHQTKFDATVNPNHRTAGYSTACQSCHTVTAWTPANFDHALTNFPLAGAHRAVSCESCHGDGVFKGKSTTCVSCHQAKFNATTTPNHQANGIPTTCTSCHTVVSWLPATFDHAVTRFPLAGAHRAVSCSGCHADGVYRGKPVTCVSCHQAKFNSTTAPNHQANGIPTTCESCHSVNTWIPATFNHATTQFPLTGRHATTTCGSCHNDGVYRGKPTTCVSCHQARFNATTQPNHQAAGISTTCQSCHSTSNWTPATFNHAVTRFPLTGAHVSTTCLACHGDGVYTGKPSACASCHTAVFNATTNPNHRTAGFPVTCESCHTTTRWTGAVFNHDGPWFPIYSGKHKQKWNSCTQCHTNSTNYQEFTCLSCHEHRQSEMDSKHQGRNGYSYQSASCYSCHPRGTH